MRFFQELRQHINMPLQELSRLPFMKSLESLFGTHLITRQLYTNSMQLIREAWYLSRTSRWWSIALGLLMSALCTELWMQRDNR